MIASSLSLIMRLFIVVINVYRTFTENLIHQDLLWKIQALSLTFNYTFSVCQYLDVFHKTSKLVTSFRYLKLFWLMSSG